MNERNEEWKEQMEADCAQLAVQLRALPEYRFRDISVRVVRTIARRRLFVRGGVVSFAAAAALVAWVLVPSGVLPERRQAPVQGLACEVVSPTDWLLAAQEADGTWDPARWGGSGVYPYAVTGFAMMALVSGGAHDADVSRAVWALRAGQSSEGRLGGTDDGSILNHAIATVALLAVYETGRFPESFTVVDGAINTIRALQDAEGRWGGGRTAELWLVDALGRASVLGWPDRGAHLRRGLRQLEAAGAPFSAAIAQASTMSDKRREVRRACETWIAANPGIRGGGCVYAQSVAAR